MLASILSDRKFGHAISLITLVDDTFQLEYKSTGTKDS
jgi:hypothetical protein